MAQRKVTQRQAEKALDAVTKQFARYLEPVTIPAMGDDPEMTLSPAYENGPVLRMEFDWYGPARPAIVWEDGPEDWAHLVNNGGVTEETRILTAQAAQEFGFDPEKAVKKAEKAAPKPARMPSGVWAEPITSWALGLYRT
jgi:hypothetical protein